MIIYISAHHGNTEKVAKAMAEVLNAKLAKRSDVNINEVSEYDLIGFGSGIYFRRHHKSLLDFIDKLPNLKNKEGVYFFNKRSKENAVFKRI